MHFDPIQPGLNEPLPRAEDDDEEDDPENTPAKPRPSSEAMLIQKKFL